MYVNMINQSQPYITASFLFLCSVVKDHAIKRPRNEWNRATTNSLGTGHYKKKPGLHS